MSDMQCLSDARPLDSKWQNRAGAQETRCVIDLAVLLRAGDSVSPKQHSQE